MSYCVQSYIVGSLLSEPLNGRHLQMGMAMTFNPKSVWLLISFKSVDQRLVNLDIEKVTTPYVHQVSKDLRQQQKDQLTEMTKDPSSP